jgi:hypothetical protein
VEQDLRYTRASTGEAAVAWIREHVPPGARIVKESYTPRLDGLPYSVLQSRFAARRTLEEIRDPANDFLLLSWNAYGRFLREERLRQPHHRVYGERYRELLALPKVREFAPGRTRLGPYLSLYRLDPERVENATGRAFGPADAAYVSPPRPGGGEGAEIELGAPGAFALFKGHFAAGRYTLSVVGGAGPSTGRVEIRTRDGAEVAEVTLEGGAATVELERSDKYFFYVRLEPGSSLARLEVAPAVNGESTG